MGLKPLDKRFRDTKQRLGRGQRLTPSALFDETYRQGQRRAGRFMVLWVRRGKDGSRRLGVVASRKVGPAVDRVRARRRLRECFRRQRPLFKETIDVILVARRGILVAPWDEVMKELQVLAQRAGALAETAPREDERPPTE